MSDDELKIFSKELAQQISGALKNSATVEGKKAKALLGWIGQRIAIIPTGGLASLPIEALSLIPKESLLALGSNFRVKLIQAMFEKIPVNKNGNKDMPPRLESIYST